MEEGVVRMQAQMFALVAEMHSEVASIEAMKAANTERESMGLAQAYPESCFSDAQIALSKIASRLRNEI